MTRTMSLYYAVKMETAKRLGCGDCTMLERWCNTVSQRPDRCKLDDRFLFCPVTGMQPKDQHDMRKQTEYLFVDMEDEKEETWK